MGGIRLGTPQLALVETHAITPVSSRLRGACATCTVRFRGVALPDGARSDGERGSVQGPIAPNGADSTTPLNCLSRLHSDQAGDIRFEGRSVNATPALGISQSGTGRTLQKLAMFRTPPLPDNVLIGACHRSSAGFLATTLRLSSVGAEGCYLCASWPTRAWADPMLAAASNQALDNVTGVAHRADP
jgi:hypothetical protein